MVDMLNDFLEPQGVLYCGQAARRIIPFVKRKVNEFRRKGDPVFFVCDAHREGDWELRIYPPHCMKGTQGARVVKEIPREKKDPFFEKRFYSGFTNPRLEKALRRLNIREVYVTGVCTSICVMEAVAGLFYRKFPVTVYEKGVADFKSKNHVFALKRMKRIFGARIL